MENKLIKEILIALFVILLITTLSIIQIKQTKNLILQYDEKIELEKTHNKELLELEIHLQYRLIEKMEYARKNDDMRPVEKEAQRLEFLKNEYKKYYKD